MRFALSAMPGPRFGADIHVVVDVEFVVFEVVRMQMLEKHTYCVKCQNGRTVIGQSAVVLKNGAAALKGKCPSCDSETYKIVNKDALNSAESQANQTKSDSLIGFALAAFSLGLAIGGAITFVGGQLF